MSSSLACKPRVDGSQVKEEDAAVVDGAEGGSGLPAVCLDRSKFEADPTKVCTNAYCDFLANEDKLPFYKVLDTGGLLNSTPGRGRALKDVDALLDLLSGASPDLAKLFACDSGVWERVTDRTAAAKVQSQLDAAWPNGEWHGPDRARQDGGRRGLPYTIGFHTRRVLQVFNDQRKYYEIPNTTFEGYRYQSYPMMVWMVATHDVGKAVAAEQHDTSLQHEFIPAISRAILTRMGLPPYEVELAVRIVDHDLVGDYMKASGPAKAQAERILVQSMEKRAAASKISVRDFWYMQRIFYISDATSYAAIRARYFGEEMRPGSLHVFSRKTVTSAPDAAFDSGELIPAKGQIVPVDESLRKIDKMLLQ